MVCRLLPFAKVGQNSWNNTRNLLIREPVARKFFQHNLNGIDYNGRMNSHDLIA